MIIVHCAVVAIACH